MCSGLLELLDGRLSRAVLRGEGYSDVLLLPDPKGLEAAKYIGRYLGHPPLATSHITHYDGQRAQFWYRETATGLRREVNVSPLEFISLLVPHIPPKGLQLVRHAGLYARNVKAK